MKTVFFNAHLVDETLDCTGAVLVEDGKIHSVVQGDFSDCDQARTLVKFFGSSEDCAKAGCGGCANQCALEFINCNGKTLMPGFIDMHVHFRFPGQTQKEDLDSGTKAAAAGGYSLVVCMPNTNPVVSSSTLAHSIENEAAKFERVDVIQSVSLTENFDGKTTSHIDDLEGISVLTEDGRDVQDSLVMMDAMNKAAAKGILVSCHSEDSSFTEKAKEDRKIAMEQYAKYDAAENKTDSKANYELLMAQTNMEEANEYLALAEDIASERNILLAKKTGCSVHLAHVSTKNSIQAVRAAKAGGQKVTCELMPHHFALSTSNKADDTVPTSFAEGKILYEPKRQLRFIVNPPIRSEEDRLALIEAIVDGTADVISTDHAPHTLEDKKNGAPGFPGLETAFSVANTFLVQSGKISLQKLSSLMSANPARLLKIGEESSAENPRGKIKKGMKADLVLIDTQKKWTVDSSKFYTKGAMTPFEGMELTGKILSTWHNGKKVFG